MQRITATFFIICASVCLMAGQPSQAVLDYIDQYKEIAVQEMIEYKIPASITMAQGILESGAGQSELARESNNHFGIKCHDDWKGDKVYYDDDAKGECFRKYDHVEDSYIDHSLFLSTKPRYAFLFDLKMDDYKGWAKGLKEAGYATNPKYADLLIGTIEEYQLYELDKMTLAEAKKHDKQEVKQDTKKDTKKTDAKSPVASNKKETKKAGNTKTDTKKDEHFSWGGYDEDVYYSNRIPTVTVKEGETPESIAKKHNIKIVLFRDYNDIEDGRNLDAGSKCYLQPKRKKGSTATHEVKAGETIWSISRDEGVRMSQLYKYNRLEPGDEPAVGEKINLRHTRKSPVELRKPESVKETPVQKKAIEPEKITPKETPIKEVHDDEFIHYDDSDATVKEQSVGVTIAPADTVTTPVSTTPSAGTSEKTPVYHTVAAKETVYGLSKQFGVTVSEIQNWNHLTDNAIQIGQQLIVGYK